MYEHLIGYVKKDDFSPTIFSNLLDSYYIASFDKKFLNKILKNQAKNEIMELDYSCLKLEEIFEVLNGIYCQNTPLKYASEMYETGKLHKLIQRLEELDVEPPKGEFDNRKYYQLRNLIILACQSSAFTKNRIIIDFDGNIKFYIDSKELPEVKRNCNFKDKLELWKYLRAIEKNLWIKILEPEHDCYWVIYPEERLLDILK